MSDHWTDHFGYSFADLELKSEINKLRRSAASNLGVAAITETLRERHDSLLLATVATWELVREKLQLTDQMLLEKMEEIDLRDGTKDGKVTGAQAERWECPKCQRVNLPRFTLCIDCKTPGPKRPLPGPFEKA